MSRTIKTMPWRVKVYDAGWADPIHDHRFNECDLPPLSHDVIGFTVVTNCHWDQTAKAYYGDVTSDGCRMCTDYYMRKWDRRRSRHQAQREARRDAKYGV